MKTKLLPVVIFALMSFLSIAQDIEKASECSKYYNAEPISPMAGTHVTATFHTRFAGVQEATVYRVGGVYYLEDNTPDRVPIRVWNARGNDVGLFAERSRLGDLRHSIRNNTNVWRYTDPSHGMGLDVFWVLQQIRNRLDSILSPYWILPFWGKTIEAFVENGGQFVDGAFWEPREWVMAFGRGRIHLPVASVDVVAHELGHTIAQFYISSLSPHHPSSGCIWLGAYPYVEGLADIFGVIMTYQLAPEQDPWRNGNMFVRGNHTSIRNIRNPNDDTAEDPIACTFGNDRYFSAGFHARGGVFTRWFYNLVNGGGGVNGIGNSYSVRGIGMDRAERLIVHAVFVPTPDADSPDSRYLNRVRCDCERCPVKSENGVFWHSIRKELINVSESVYDINNAELKAAVTNAWHAVGVGGRYLFVVDNPINHSQTIRRYGNIILRNVTIAGNVELTVSTIESIYLYNVTIQNGARLILSAGSDIIIDGYIDVHLGAEFEMR